MENHFTKRDGLFVANQIPDAHRPDVYVDCLLDKEDGGIKSAYGVVYDDYVIELYHLLDIDDNSDKLDIPEFELIHTDTDNGTKRFFRVVLDHEVISHEGGEA